MPKLARAGVLALDSTFLLLVLAVLPESYVRAIAPRLAAPFRDAAAQMECLTLLLCATRA